MHGSGTWILRQQIGGKGEQDLSELRNMHAQVYAELPKKSRVLHKDFWSMRFKRRLSTRRSK
jgi:hypothetical protein